MIAIIFELEPHEHAVYTYLDMAADLRPVLEQMDGFISVERFESLVQPGKYLSLSFWRDEEAVQQWRNLEEHRHAQTVGRKSVFREYRLRVADVLRDYGMNAREEAPIDSKRNHGAD